MTAEDRVAALELQVRRLQAEGLIRACVTRYMALCDRLDVHSPIEELAGLFTEDAVWEGRGARYAGSFGGYRGRAAISHMFRTYMTEPPHFALNAHFLCSETLAVDADAMAADASWVMLQTSSFASGASHLNAAQLRLRLRVEDGAWRIAHFQTENLFSRPTTAWNDAAPLPVPAHAAYTAYTANTADTAPGTADDIAPAGRPLQSS